MKDDLLRRNNSHVLRVFVPSGNESFQLIGRLFGKVVGFPGIFFPDRGVATYPFRMVLEPTQL